MAKAGMGEAGLSGAATAMLDRTSTERRAEFAQSVLNRALVLFKSGQFDSADVLLETMEQEPAVRQRALHMRGVIALYRGEDDKALDYLEEAIRLEPADGEAHANLGALLLKARQYPQALAACAAALSLLPGNAAALLGLAQALVGAELPELAIDAYRDVLAVVPDHAEASAALASLLQSGVIDSESVIVSDGVDAARSTGARTDPVTDPVLAVASRMTGAPRVAGAVLCDALFVDGCRHHRDGDEQRAKRTFEQILAIDAGHVNTLCNLGALEIDRGQVARAQGLLQSAISLAPELPPARIALADALMAGGKTEQAVVQYRRALELAPGSDVAHAQYALALHSLGDLTAAMSHFLAAIRINQRQSPRFYETLGHACAARGNAQGAEISFKHALALDPLRITAHCALGELYLSLADQTEAEASFRAALTLNADHAAAARGLERVLGADARQATGGTS
jgi:tetratricopeptide (TPR) repeat protein